METLAGGALVQAAQAGDKGAMADLVHHYLPLAYNVVGHSLNGGGDVDDIVQETMLRVVQSLPTLRDPLKFRPWLISIAIRQIQERGRARKLSLSRDRPLDQAADQPDPTLDVAEITVLCLGLSVQRQEAVEARRWIREEDQRLLALWWQETAGAISRSDLARTLRITPALAAVRVQRMKAQLISARRVIRAWNTQPGCAQLEAEVAAWDGGPAPRGLKRFTRHVSGCQRCLRVSADLVPAEHLLLGIEALAAAG